MLPELRSRTETLTAAWNTARPFRWVVIDDFLPRDTAETLLREFPPPEDPRWQRGSYLHQSKKLAMCRDLPAAHEDFFRNSSEPGFVDLLSGITGIPELLPDPMLHGGGLHQSLDGGFLDVHVDYNYHPKLRWHRRLNLLVYLNRDWKPANEGYLELWDMRAGRRLAEIAPIFNRAVLFETNDVSFHGHPHPIVCGPETTRKSLAVYYFTEEREDGHAGPESNTQYRFTTGPTGYVKALRSGLEAASDYVRRDGLAATSKRVADKLRRAILREPPKND